jgi:hypothetical protein
LTLFQLIGCTIIFSGGMIQVATSKINQGAHY